MFAVNNNQRMIPTRNLIFEGWKFKSKEFAFKNKVSRNKFFDKALIESPIKFFRLNDQMLVEKMHIAYSWLFLFRTSAYVLLVPALIGTLLRAPHWMNISIVILSMIFMLRSRMLTKRMGKIALTREFFNAMEEATDIVEEVRKKLIEEN